MIRIENEHTKNGSAAWSHNGTIAKGLCDLARLLLPSIGDVAWEAGRPGRVDMTGKSLAWLAEHTASENDKQKPAFREWSPHPMAAKPSPEIAA